MLIALKYEIDTKIVVFGTVILGVFTQAFAGVAALIATLPVVGPLIIKIFTIIMVLYILIILYYHLRL